MIGNPLLWWTGTCSILLFFILLLFYILRRRRCVYDLPNGNKSIYINILNCYYLLSLLLLLDVFEQWLTSGLFLAIGWIAHYLPYFFISRVLFLHHYLPALPFKFMILAAMCEHGFAWVNKFKWYVCVCVQYYILYSYY